MLFYRTQRQTDPGKEEKRAELDPQRWAVNRYQGKALYNFRLEEVQRLEGKDLGGVTLLFFLNLIFFP